MKRKALIISLLLAVVLLVAGCTSTDAIHDCIYIDEIYTLNGATWWHVVPGVGVEADPVWSASPSAIITLGDIGAWTNHPIYTSGIHGVTGDIVGTSDAQSLTNKQILMNNNDYIKWKDATGNIRFVLRLDNTNILDLANTSGMVYLQRNREDSVGFFGATTGTGCRVIVFGSDSSAGDPLMDSASLRLRAKYWTGAADASRDASFLHSMITSGASPKSQLQLSIAGLDVQYWENDNGATTTFITSDKTNITLSVYADNAAAIAGGLVQGDLYRTGGDPDVVCVVH